MKILLPLFFLVFGIGNVMADNIKTEKAILAGGCFWCTEQALDTFPGVISAVSGYTGGQTKNPTYEQIGSGKTGHYEAIEVTYDASKLDYNKVLNVFWLNIDPLDAGGQFADRGTQYYTAIFYLNDKQKAIAEASKAKVEKLLGQPIATAILPAKEFYKAEEYHQDYYKKNPLRYNLYKRGSGRVDHLHRLWEGLAKELHEN